jgi:curved DNA-binding protein CbpA
MQARLIFFLLVCLFCISFVEADQGDAYFSMIEDISSGINYYNTMGLTSDVTPDQIRKTWRKLVLVHHPDKNPDPANVAYFAILKRAYETLSDEVSRAEYDKLLVQGIPWQDKYYGRYAHRYGAPDHDVRYVILGVIVIITVFKHLYSYYRYHQLQTAAKRDLLKKQAKEDKAKGIKKKKKKKELGKRRRRRTGRERTARDRNSRG